MARAAKASGGRGNATGKSGTSRNRWGKGTGVSQVCQRKDWYAKESHWHVWYAAKATGSLVPNAKESDRHHWYAKARH